MRSARPAACAIPQAVGSRVPDRRKKKKALRWISATLRKPNAGLVSLTMACLSYLVVLELQGNHRIASLTYSA
jgi:hypothetical protein